MSQNTRYREQIDACRPGSADLALPALADLAQAAESDRAVAAELARSQRFDVAVSAALHDVPVPAGLLERLEAKLASGESARVTESSLGELVERAISASEHTVVGQAGDAEPGRSQPLASRRTWLLTCGLAASAALAILITIANLPRKPRSVSRDELGPAAMDWVADVDSPTGWTAFSSGALPAGFPQDTAVRGRVTRWKSFRTDRGDSGIAYDLTPPGGRQVLLLVLRSPDNFNVDRLPYSTLPGATNGRALGAWQRTSNGVKLLYVLVVVGDMKTLDDYVRKPRIT